MARKTVFLSCHPSAGGSGVVASELALGLAEREHDVHLFSSEIPFRYGPLPPKGVTVHTPSPIHHPLFQKTMPHGFALAQSLLCQAQSTPPDILHAHYAFPFALVHQYVAGILKQRGQPCQQVVTLHGTDTTLLASDPCYLDLIRQALERVDGLSAVSSSLALETLSTFGLTRSVDVIPNWVSPQFHPHRPPHPAIAAAHSANEVAVLHLSNFRPIKRPDIAIKAFSTILANRPARLFLAGDGPEKEGALALARSLGIHNRVESLGSLREIETLYPTADLLLSSSDHESFGLAVLEALASGVPVASTAVGGVPDLLGKGSHGALASAGDGQALGKAALTLLVNPKDRSLSAINRAKDFSPEIALEKYETLYSRVSRDSRKRVNP